MLTSARRLQQLVSSIRLPWRETCRGYIAVSSEGRWTRLDAELTLSKVLDQV